MIGGLQGENGDLNIKYLKKKSKSVGRKYLEALKRILQACKMAAKFASWRSPFRSHHLMISRPKADFVACEIGLQLGVIGFQWLYLLHFNSDSCTIWSVGLLTSQASKRHIVWMNWASKSALKVSNSCYPLEFFMLDFSLCFPSLHSWFAYGKGL